MTVNPVLAEVTRGTMVESRHRGAFAIVRHTGETLAAHGAVDVPTYGRSAIKPLQALPLVESGAADAFDLSTREISLACASHNSEPVHVDTVAAWLDRIGVGAGALECGPHLPYYEAAAHVMVEAGTEPTAVHNNCSGKHSGFLTTARFFYEAIAGYIQPDHPVQQRVRKVMSEMTDTDLANAPTGADGCGIPVIGISLRATAYAMARFAQPDGLPEARATAARRVFDAVTTEPFMVAGSGRFCTQAMQLAPGRMLVKTGAEAYYCAALPEQGLGIALKIDDGNKRASEPVMAALLGTLLDHAGLNARATTVLRNVGGTTVGEIRAALSGLDPTG